MLETNLKELGFTPNQIKVYLTLLKRGQTKVGPIVSALNLHRYVVYQSLQGLTARKLVTQVKKRGVTYYSPTDPKPLLEEFKKKEKLAAETIKDLKKLGEISPSEVSLLTGQQGIVDLYEMILYNKEDLYLIGSNFTIGKRYKKTLSDLEGKIRASGITHHILAQPDVSGLEKLDLKIKLRYLPKSFPPSPHVIWVAGDLSAHVLWEDPELVWLIKNKKIADNYRQYFGLLWKQARGKKRARTLP